VKTPHDSLGAKDLVEIPVASNGTPNAREVGKITFLDPSMDSDMFEVWWDLLLSLYCKFAAESDGERISKIR